MAEIFCLKHCLSGKRLLHIPLAAGLLAAAISVPAAEPIMPVMGPDAGSDQATFYQESKEGWFWYHDPLPEPELEPDELFPEQSLQIPNSQSSLRSRNIDDYTMDELWNMYPDDFQDLLNHVENVAVQKPTEENVLKYMSLQDVARRKALAYTNAAMFVSQKYNDRFNTGQVYPTSSPGVDARVQMQREEVARTIAQAKNNHALVFFTKDGCGFCGKQAQILSYFVERYGWQIKEVNISRNSGAAVRFNVTVTPALLLVRKGEDKSLTVATGVATVSELERNLYRAIRYLQGDTRGDTFLLYDFQKDSPLDPASILKQGSQPWKTAN